MRKTITEYLGEVEEFTSAASDEIEAFRVKYLGSKGLMKELFKEFKNVPGPERKEVGILLNELKKRATEKVTSLQAAMGNASVSTESSIDVTRPGFPYNVGSRHPVSLVMNEIIDIFRRMSFTVAEGPEIEDDWHNFTSLNFPEEHPARDMQDTFFVDLPGNFALRTHTSSVQARVMESQEPPIRVIAPGRVYRNEAISPRSHCIFHQIEGLLIDKDVSFADLKLHVLYFARQFFGEDARIRLRPSYFPFTEPSAEVDVYWGLETEADYRITKGTGWLEILGCGMVDPNVLRNFDIDPKEYSGFAFGLGIERIAMLRYEIDDIRWFYENDARFLNQFRQTF
ncbi:MAG TPA: phenylalanine--tRNA ligase subunit alpha [Flavobacteriales bacterium]|nr:phenylalanine--tRNA ligase subunit alpha [Flavobacteriales bacterium]